ncbi:DUF1440 domain-containing protein [Staphylococcus sp. SQ8-PEA]|uniref:DUF1440 domain-containing protein n=1 Tax=Staphylococcus marylandisciuri TaxID=2981529 RepID=A0ABT2QMV2_9STAP|nr:DUF1440 domain-containing protein [Staphylococcus marylandisciuri]MCU5745300.1 DUF1440 domain-containing protein [Staphylococcus marylandisciuri]
MTQISCKRIVLTGIAGGLLAGAVKFGWEGLFPPRTPEREEEPPPLTLLNRLNVSDKVKDYRVVYNRNFIPVAVMGIHYGFSVVNALVYAGIAEYNHSITRHRGSWFGIAIHVLFHDLLLPRLGLTPKLQDLPPQERVSEFFGHVIWANTIELVRQSIKVPADKR